MATVIQEGLRLRWSRLADRIENLAKVDRCLGKYRQLVRDLRRGAIGERCDERAEKAIEKLSL